MSKNMQSEHYFKWSVKSWQENYLSLPIFSLLLRAMAYISWEELSRDDQLLCIGREVPGANFSGYKVWLPAHCLKERWMKEIEIKVRRIVADAYHTSTSSPSLYMLSMAERSEAKPFVVYFDRKLRKAAKAVQALEDSDDMRRFGFAYLAQGGLQALTGDAGERGAPHLGHATGVADHSEREIIVCKGMIRNDETNGKRGTIGGILRFGDDEYYGMTSAHIFFNDFDNSKGARSNASESASPSPVSDSAEDFESADIVPEVPACHHVFSVAKDVAVPLERNESLGRLLTLRMRDRYLGKAFSPYELQNIGLERLYNPSQDWALFRVEDPRLQHSNEIKIGPNAPINPVPGYLGNDPPSDELWVISGPCGIVEASGLGMKSSITLPWSAEYVDAWPIACELDVGCCGSWVIQKDTKIICGIIVAGCPGTGLSWMLPANPIFSALLAQWKGSISSVQSVFQMPERDPVHLFIPDLSRQTKSARLQSQVISPDLSRSDPLQDRNFSNPQSAIPVRNPIIPLQVTKTQLYIEDPQSSTESPLPSERPSTQLTSDFGSGSRVQSIPKHNSRLERYLDDVAYSFVAQCPDYQFDHWFAFIQRNPWILSVEPSQFFDAAKTLGSKEYHWARKCLSRGIVLKDIAEDLADKNLELGTKAADTYISTYFEPLVKEEPAATAKFWNRLEWVWEAIQEEDS